MLIRLVARLIPLPLRKRWRSRQYQIKQFTRTRVGRHSLYRLQRVPVHISEYYDFIAAGVVSALLSAGPKPRRRIYLGFSKHMSNLPAAGSKVLIQHEHTIVVGQPDFSVEKETEFHWSKRGSKWVRLQGPLQGFTDASWIVEYSAANRANLLDSDFAPFYAEKVLYVAPLLGKFRQDSLPRDVATVNTMFGSPDKGRRAAFLERAAEQGIKVGNLRGFPTIQQALESTAVLVNIRQKEYFQTLEELRVLPALLEGVLVVTEDSPYLDSVPYFEHVIRSSSSDIMETLKRAASRYEKSHNECFGGSKFTEVLEMMAASNTTQFKTIAQSRG